MPAKSSPSRFHIGVLISSLEENCQQKLWKGIEERARELDIDIIAYLSTFQQKDGMVAEHYSVVFDAMLQNSSLDGIILFSGFIAEDIGSVGVASLIQRCSSVPLVSIAMSFPGVTSLMTDNRAGIYQTVSHLLSVHNYKRIAFVKGPEDHQEAIERFSGYCEALSAAGIPVDNNLVLSGHFSSGSGELAVRELYDIRQENVDAICCADDETAMGVFEELTRRGINIPQDVAVCGFDDIENAEIVTPSLTTAAQSFHEIGREAVESLVERISGRAEAKTVHLPPKSIIRQSCGCVTALPPVLQFADQRSTLQETMAVHSEHLFRQTSFSNSERQHWSDTICNHIDNSFNTELFLKEIDWILIYYRLKTPDLSPWKMWFAILLAELRTLNLSIDLYADRSEAILQAVQLVDSAEQRSRRHSEIMNSEAQWQVRGIAQTLGTSFDIKTLTERLRSGATELGIRSSMIFLYNEPCFYDKWISPKFVTFVYGFNDRGEIRPDMHELLLPINEITDLIKCEQKRHRCTLFYMPLFFDLEQIGVIVMEYNPKQPIDIYEPLRLNVSTALKGAALFEKIERQSITDELTQLYNRRGFITFSLAQLAHMRRSSVTSSLFFIDMDGLKAINDNFGHKAGDYAIQVTAHILRDTLREGDIIGRLGGDEFTVLALNVSQEQTLEVVRRIRKSFDDFNKTANLGYKVSCSIGTQYLTLYTEEAFELALQKADELLYLEKSEKRKKGIGRL